MWLEIRIFKGCRYVTRLRFYILGVLKLNTSFLVDFTELIIYYLLNYLNTMKNVGENSATGSDRYSYNKMHYFLRHVFM